MVPGLAVLSAFLTVILFYARIESAVAVGLVITIILGVLSVFAPGKKTEVSGRVAGMVAIGLAAVPAVAPKIHAMRLQSMAAARAVAMKPNYDALDRAVAELKPRIEDYYRRNGMLPEFFGATVLPIVDEYGAMKTPPKADSIAPPKDPFSPKGDVLRWATVGDGEVMLVSVGQDGVAELPLPGARIDKPPVYYLTGFANLGVDIRQKTYDPKNGALGVGDIVRFVGNRKYEDAMKPLFAAYDLAHQRSPWRPTVRKRASDPDPDPQAKRDAIAAEKLLGERAYIPALYLAARAAANRHMYPKQWTAAEFTVERTRGMALFHLGAVREAADQLNDYVASAPNDAFAHFYLAAALYHGGNLSDARIHCAAAAQISMTDPIIGPAYGRYTELLTGARAQFPLPEFWISKNK